MSSFIKIFLGQLLKIVVLMIAVCIGLYLAFPAGSWLSPQPGEMPPQWLFLLFAAIGFFGGLTLLFLFEYRQKLNARSFLSESLLMLGGLAFSLVIAYLGIRAIAFALSSNNPQETDPHGFVAIPVFLGGAILSIVLGVLLGALLTALWKLKREGKNAAAETSGQLY